MLSFQLYNILKKGKIMESVKKLGQPPSVGQMKKQSTEDVEETEMALYDGYTSSCIYSNPQEAPDKEQTLIKLQTSDDNDVSM